MPDLLNGVNITDTMGLLAPGAVILWIRGRFRDAQPPALSKDAASFTLISAAYNATMQPIFHYSDGVPLPLWLWSLLLYFIVPIIIAFGIVFFDQSEGFYKIVGSFGLKPTHHVPTAWDYMFRSRAPAYALVHLTDGSVVAGAWVDGSFASSTTGDRDLLLSQMWRLMEDGQWQSIEPPRSVLICGGSIRLVEFIEGG